MENYRVLFVEDNPQERQRVHQILEQAYLATTAKGYTFEMSCAGELASALEVLTEKPFDVVLLTLDLPDSKGVNTLVRLKNKSPHIPVVVLTGIKDDTVRVQAMQMGVQGYLTKDQIDSKLLAYALSGAIEQIQQISHIEQNLLQQQQKLELQGLEQLVDIDQTSVTAKLFGLSLLRESTPDIFNDLVQQYSEILDLALEQQSYRVNHHLGEHLRNLAEQVGLLKAAPRDIIDIHTIALKKKTKDIHPAKGQAYITEGRLMVLELMGYLTSYYRRYFIGLSKLNLAKNYGEFNRHE